MVKKKKLKNRRWFKVLLFIIKIPYFIVKYLYEGIKYIVNLFQKKRKKIKVEKKRKRRYPKYKKFEVIKKEKGSFEKLEKSFLKDKGKIGIILGGRGSGKTAMGIKLLENIYAKTKKKCFSIGMKKEDLPSWIKSIENPEEIENNSFVLVDEGGVLFSSRKSMSNANKVLSDLILLSRHKGINILFISQNSSNLEVTAEQLDGTGNELVIEIYNNGTIVSEKTGGGVGGSVSISISESGIDFDEIVVVNDGTEENPRQRHVCTESRRRITECRCLPGIVHRQLCHTGNGGEHGG